MKCSPLLLLSIWIIISGHTPHHEPSDKKLIADYVFIPSGSEGDSIIPEFYISAIEITNLQYKEFIKELTDSGATEKLKIATVKGEQWSQLYVPCGPYLGYYFEHPAYDDYPVVNISKRAAELYCDWLTEKYNRLAKKKARFALPTEMQWEYAAKGGNPKAIYPWPGNSVTITKKGKTYGMRLCNYQADSTRISDLTAPSRSFSPNTYGIYNMSGNAAEMIADQDYTKGGSYGSPAAKVLIAAHEEADIIHGSPYIGFRPVMIYETGH